MLCYVGDSVKNKKDGHARELSRYHLWPILWPMVLVMGLLQQCLVSNNYQIYGIRHVKVSLDLQENVVTVFGCLKPAVFPVDCYPPMYLSLMLKKPTAILNPEVTLTEKAFPTGCPS